MGHCMDCSRSAVPAPPFWDTVGGRRLLQRYTGHCNCATDIKEAAFLGQHDDLVACGSDDGRVFIYSSVRGTSAC
jgi:WD40 repeat protein